MNNQQLGVYIGLDIGGTEIKGGIVSPAGVLLSESRIRTPIEEGSVGLLRDIKGLVSSFIKQTDVPVLGIGVGSAGRIDSVSGKVIYATDNLPGWTGVMLADEIAEAVNIPVYAENDVNVAAIGEAWVGAAQHCNTFALIALGTGVGGAIVNEGRMLHGVLGGAGEIGHTILVPGGLPCNCGQRGCLEQYVSGTALGRIAKEIDPHWNSHTLMKRYEQGDSRAMNAIHLFVTHLANGIITLWNMFDPVKIVIGGGLITSKDIWWSCLETTLIDLSPHKSIAITPAILGNQAGIIGAARLPTIIFNHS